ncbi:hypothetical protein GCM10007907_28020 [Chitinimonas prasina]|uniref:HEAT repeat domain-containing protein n=1 Tax=Chitinimonas prasina TaxID=1434937 RepID=A0ABQ5YG91_9NEIS|nr:hypothetical protein [Chitinimonas prasina]GLR14012.1 hypothetical protein GCM10007907_28020 [Chitinimonas prasina]
MYADFDNYLGLEFLVDYWYDEGTGVASSLLSKFNEQDWIDLKEKCKLKSDEWKVRCAEVLDLASHPASTEVLIDFLGSESDEVVLAAADSLRGKNTVQLSSEVIERLWGISEKGSPPVQVVLRDLFGRLGLKLE